METYGSRENPPGKTSGGGTKSSPGLTILPAAFDLNIQATGSRLTKANSIANAENTAGLTALLTKVDPSPKGRQGAARGPRRTSPSRDPSSPNLPAASGRDLLARSNSSPISYRFWRPRGRPGARKPWRDGRRPVEFDGEGGPKTAGHHRPGSRRQPEEPLREDRARARPRRNRRRAPPRDRLPARPLPLHRRHEREPGHRFRGEHQPVQRMLSWLHLLLCPPHARIPWPLGRAGLREQGAREGRRAGAVARAIVLAAVGAEGSLDERGNRSLPARGAEARDHVRLPRSPRGFPQPRSRGHQKPPRYQGHRPAGGARPIRGRGRRALPDEAGPRPQARHGAENVQSRPAAGSDPEALGGRRPGRCDNCARDPGPQRPRAPEPPLGRRGRGRHLRRVRPGAPPRGRRPALRGLAGAPLPGPQGEGAGLHPLHAGRKTQRSGVRVQDEGRGRLRGAHLAAFRRVLPARRDRAWAVPETIYEFVS